MPVEKIELSTLAPVGESNNPKIGTLRGARPRRDPDAMAEHLASIFGTEKDRVNCPFYFKVREALARASPRRFRRRSDARQFIYSSIDLIPDQRRAIPPQPRPLQIGACRHGERCSRLHNKPTLSQTILMSNMYQSPAAAAIANPSAQINTDPRAIQEHFEDFYEDIFEELAKYGEIEGLNVCDNTSDHLIGNVYVKFREEESALAALNALSGRFYSGRPILCEFSPVTDFRESTCRQYEENTCNRGGYCNFMHLKPISRQLRKILFGRYKRRDDDRREGDRGRDRGDDRGGRGGDRRGDSRDGRGRGPPGGGGPDRGRGGYDDRRRDGPYDRRGDDRGGRGGYDDRRPRSRDRYGDDRRRDDSRGRGGDRDDRNGGGGGGGGGGVSAKGMSDADRRAMFAKWNAEGGDRDDGGGAGGSAPRREPEEDDRYRR